MLIYNSLLTTEFLYRGFSELFSSLVFLLTAYLEFFLKRERGNVCEDVRVLDPSLELQMKILLC